MGRSVAVVCPKGGVGKTTVAVNLAAALADKGFKCLVVGIDPQCGVVSSFGRDRFSVDFGLMDFFDPDGSPERSIQGTGIENLDFISSNVWSREEEEQLLTWAAISPESLVAGLAPLKRDYDFVLLDCPPNLGHLTSAALMAADSMIVPLQAEELALQALPRLFDTLAEIRRSGQSTPELAGIVLNQVDLRTRMANSVLDRVRQAHEGRVFATLLPRSVRLAEVAQRGKPVNLFNRSGAAAQAFAELAEELLSGLLAERRSSEGERAQPAAGSTVPREELRQAVLSPEKRRAPVLTATGEIISGEEEEDEQDEAFISLDEVDESGGEVCRVTRPDLDEYDGVEEGWH